MTLYFTASEGQRPDRFKDQTSEAKKVTGDIAAPRRR